MIILQVNDVSRKFADETLYENVTFHIQERERIALVGRNGTGKSTLIKQIMYCHDWSLIELSSSVLFHHHLTSQQFSSHLNH